MPKGLVKRFRKECIREFRAAAQQRYLDGIALMNQNRRSAAIYLWGYAAEMTLKAAYFQALKYSADAPIERLDLKGASQKAKLFNLNLGNYHDLFAWANLLVNTRRHTSGLAYGSLGLSIKFLKTVGSLGRVWTETIRYHKNVAYRFEVEKARQTTEWLLLHSLEL